MVAHDFNFRFFTGARHLFLAFLGLDQWVFSDINRVRKHRSEEKDHCNFVIQFWGFSIIAKWKKEAPLMFNLRNTIYEYKDI